jgi:hypothetical protein
MARPQRNTIADLNFTLGVSFLSLTVPRVTDPGSNLVSLPVLGHLERCPATASDPIFFVVLLEE